MAHRERTIGTAQRRSGTARDRAVGEWNIDVVLARHAAGGPFTRAALLADGVPPRMIDRRVRSGHLVALWPGVYWLAGASLTPHGRHLAASLASGPRAVVSSLNAAVEWALVDDAGSELHVTVPPQAKRRPRGVIVHRAALTRHEVRRRDGLLVASPVRTLQDLAATHPHLLDGAVQEAYARRLVRPGGLAPRPGQRGARALRQVVAADRGVTRSELERLLRRLLARAGLPAPETNIPIGPWEVDFLWREAMLVVETDGYAAHAGRRAFERDRRKDADLKLRGHEVLRLSHRQITAEPERVVATLAVLLARERRVRQRASATRAAR